MIASIKYKQDERSKFWVPTISVAASVLLKNRCLHMNAFQILMNTIMHHSSQTVSILYTVFYFFKRQKKLGRFNSDESDDKDTLPKIPMMHQRKEVIKF